MARGTTLVKLLDNLRAECRLSLNPAHNIQVRETQVAQLQRVQEQLWEDFTWPHLRVERQILVQAGQRFYNPPEDMHIDRIETIELYDDGIWQPVRPGIEPWDYSAWNSDRGERAWPPRRWKIAEDEQVELWPIPDQNADPETGSGTLKFTGIRNLKPLVDDGDRADLDDRMLVLYAAAEILAAGGSKDAQLKLDLANRRFARLRADLTPRRSFQMFGVGDRLLPRRPMITRYRPPYNTGS